MILDTDVLTFTDNAQIYATPVDGGGGNVSYTPFSDTPAPTLPDSSSTQQQQAASTVPFTPPKLFRFLAPTGPANDVPTPSSGLSTYVAPGSTGGVLAVVASPTTKTPTGSGAAAGSTSVTSGPTSPLVASTGDDMIGRLIDLVAAQYGGGSVKGGGTGFGGMVSGPLGTPVNATGGTSGGSGKTLLLIAVVLGVLGYWYYKHHHKGHAA